eukprot:scaffold397406_cov24-Prasinocladus_malaysianus.AAC.1
MTEYGSAYQPASMPTPAAHSKSQYLYRRLVHSIVASFKLEHRLHDNWPRGSRLPPVSSAIGIHTASYHKSYNFSANSLPEVF